MIFFNDMIAAYVRIAEECWAIMEEQIWRNNEQLESID
jgi:hypothetical protein